MIVLTENQNLCGLCGSAPANTVSMFSVSYAPTGGAIPTENTSVFVGTTETTMVTGPTSAGISYIVGSISVYNYDKIAHQFTISKLISGTYYVLYSANLQPGWTLSYSSGGWAVSDQNGALVTTVPYTKNQANGLLVLDTNAYVPVMNLPPSVQGGFKNQIINGGFDFFQRGTPITANVTTGSLYGPDRWFLQVGVANVSLVAVQENFSSATQQSAASATGAPNFCVLLESTCTNASSFSIIRQTIENSRLFAGETATLSFWAKTDSTSANVIPYFYQNFGNYANGTGIGINSGGTFANITLSNVWTQYTYTFQPPSLNGQTVGTSDALIVGLLLGGTGSITTVSNTTYTFSVGAQTANVYLAQVQLEAGPDVTSYERRQLGLELAMCQRYFEKSYDLSVAPGTITGNTSLPGVGTYLCYFSTSNTAMANTKFSVPFNVKYSQMKRVDPTLTFYSPILGTAGFAFDTVSNSNISIGGTTGQGSFQGAVGGTANSATINTQFHWTAAAEF
jgi:hypothetical protein